MERLGLGPEVDAGAQPAAGVRAHDRLGPGRPARRPRRPRHQLHRPVGRAARDRPRRRGAGAAAQPGRRLRRRRHAARLRHRLRRDRGAQQRSRPGRRCGDGRRRVAARDDVLRHARRRQLERGARRQHPRRRRALVRQLRDRDGKFVAIGAIEPKFYAELLQRLEIDPATLPQQHDRAGWPAMRARFAAAFRGRTPRRVVHRLRRLRRLLRAGAHVLGIAPPSARRGARRRDRARRHRPAGAGAALRAHPRRGAPAAARTR